MSYNYKEQELHNSVPVATDVSEPYEAQNIRNAVLMCKATGGTSTITCVLQGSINGTNWVALDSMSDDITPAKDIIYLSVANNPWKFLRVFFSVITTGGDSVEVLAGGNGG